MNRHRVATSAVIPRLIALISLVLMGAALPIGAQPALGAEAAADAGNDKLFDAGDASLRRYRCPEWFRDAKFGIWAVWGPESVPMQGDWYARHLYEQGSRDYRWQLAHYGHPSKFGFKDIIPLWKAERWDPDRLMALYRRAGAKYFCMIAMHHDNFDCWNSRFQRWNAVNMGPKRDIAGEWQKAAAKDGLRFGMTEHLAASWWFYSVAKGADRTGPMAGVPYDGADPKFKDLYWSGNEHPNGTYYLPNAPAAVQQTWFDRVSDMIDRYHPDLLYSDSPLPYPEQYGRRLLAHFYNDSIQRHGGRLQAVYNCKQDAQGRWVQDLERGIMGEIRPEPWQTDTCIGDWYYDQNIFTQHRYKSATTIIHMLADIVSKNGNLLLNFPLRPDGTLDSDELKILDQLGAWVAVNGEAIYGTRPWQVYGEGGRKIQGGGFNESRLRYTARDIRFTTRGQALYAIALGWPESGKLIVRSLAAPAGRVTGVVLLGHPGALEWSQTPEGLVVTLPAVRPCESAWSLKITGENLKAVPVPADAVLIRPDADGRITLPAREAEIHGNSPVYEEGDGKDQIGYWGDAKDFVSWTFKAPGAATYKVEVTYSCAAGAQGSAFDLDIAGRHLTGISRSTGSWATYTTQPLGTVQVDKAGACTLTVRPKVPPAWKVIGLKSVVLTPVRR